MKRFLTFLAVVLAVILSSVLSSSVRILGSAPVRAEVGDERKPGRMSQEQRQALNELSAKLTEVSLNENEVPAWISGELGPANGKPKDAAVETMRRLAPVFRSTANDGFEPRSEIADKLGQTHVRMQQRYRGLPVVGGDLIVHLQGKRVIGVNGHFVPDINLETTPALSADAAIDFAVWTVSSGEVEKLASAELVVYITRDHIPHLAWSQPVSYIYSSGLDEKAVIYADAGTGELLGASSLVMRAKFRQIYDGHETCYNAAQSTFIWQEGDPLPPWNPSSSEAATYKRTGDIYDFYKNVFGRDSYDGQGATIKSTVHLRQGATCTDPNILAWVGTGLFSGLFPNELRVGDGDNITYANPAGSMTLMAHEFTHGVINFSAHLDYDGGESGALNESFSDAMAVSAEAYTFGSTFWKIGWDVYTPGTTGDAVRYMYDPPKDQGQNVIPRSCVNQPPSGYNTSVDYYPDLIPPPSCDFCAPWNDHCYVHFNSGIGNLAYYLLVHGGQHPEGKTAVVVPAIGVSTLDGFSKASKIWYRALTTYLTSESNYADARSATIHAASDIFGLCSPEAVAVEKAWMAVGVPNNYNVIWWQPPACDFNLLNNPGFESTYSEGSTATGWFHDWIVNPYTWGLFTQKFFDGGANPPAHSGFVKAKFGNDNLNLPQTMYQEVTIPSTANGLGLDFYLLITTSNQTPNADKLAVEIRDTSDHILWTLATYTNSDPNALLNPNFKSITPADYRLKSFSLTNLLPYIKGKKIRLYFDLLSDTDACNGCDSLETQFWVDDTALIVDK